ncbi:MAG TPA: DciA family protein [Nocardioides sp.]|nr:DciA family protein [Nocardioides sp.]
MSPDPTPDAEEPGQPAHAADGLDLARTLARVTARSTPGRKSAARRKTGRWPGTGRVSGAHPDDRDPQTLDAALTRVVDDQGWQVDLKVASMFARWAELVGAEIGAHSHAESFADGKLVVRTDSTAWATQLRLLAPTVVRRLNEDLGHGTVAVIEVLGPHGPSWKHGTRSVRDGRGPRDTYG